MIAARRPTAAELVTLRRLLRREVPFGDADLVAIEPAVRVQRLRRGEHLLRAGEIARDCGVVVEGVLREYFSPTATSARADSRSAAITSARSPTCCAAGRRAAR